MKVGDEITVGGRAYRLAVVVEVYERMIIARDCAANDVGLQLAEEGITWISGQHAEDSTEYAALLAAWKLRSKPAMRVRFADDTATVALRGVAFDILNGQTLNDVLPTEMAPVDRFGLLVTLAAEAPQKP